jgi:hypothetical protein
MRELFIKRVFAEVIDKVILVIFTIAFWCIANNSFGMIFNRVFFSERMDAKSISSFLPFFLSISFVFFLWAGVGKGLTLGKTMLNLKIESTKDNSKLKSFIIRELFWKWFVLLIIPSILFVTNLSRGLLIIGLFLSVYLIINTISWIFKKKSLIDILSMTNVVESTNGKHILVNHTFLSLSALVIDLSLVVTTSLLIDFLIQGILYIQFFHILFINLFFYHLIASLLNGNTFGKYYLGIKISGTFTTGVRNKIFKRELVYKFGLSVLIPYLLLNFLGIVDSYHIFLDILVIVGFIIILFYATKGEMWWSYLAETNKFIKPLSNTKTIITFLFLVLFFGSSFICLKKINNSQHDEKVKVLGFNFPFKFPEYPNSKEVGKYTEFISKQSQSPKDYLIGLFEKYDIVILCESFHGESTQWEMIYDVVSDNRFIENVGNIFTEYGSVIHQNKIDKYLMTNFENDTLREKATALLMDYMSGGFYYFVKNINKLNCHLPDSLKIREYYTDIIDWDYCSAPTRFNVPNLNKRDSLMAQLTINWFKNQRKYEKRKKCLVVTNYRHAFGYAGGVEQVKNNPKFLNLTSGNQGQYIYEAFPTQTACVVQNCPNDNSKAFFFPFKSPIHHGIWDKAFQLNNYRPVGFDLKGSPFGTDDFDMYNIHGAKQRLNYQDIFTGVVFNKQYIELKNVNYPFKRYALEQEYRSKHAKIDSIDLQNWLRRFNSDSADTDNTMRWAIQISIANFLGIFFFLGLICVSLLIATYHLIKRIIKS